MIPFIFPQCVFVSLQNQRIDNILRYIYGSIKLKKINLKHLKFRLFPFSLFTIFLFLIIGYLLWVPLSYSQESTPRRVNTPHFEDTVDWAETAIFWFGKNEQGVPSRNYTDVRTAYTDDALHIRITVIDYFLWYHTNPTPSDDLTQYDSVAIYLDTNLDRATTPQTDDYLFLVGARHWQDMENYVRQARGNGSDWDGDWTPGSAWSGSSGMSWQCNPGPNSNDCGIDYGWTAFFTVPWSTLGFSGMPPEETLLGLGVHLFDRDDQPPAGYVSPEQWPETFNANNPSSWGEIHLGEAHYQPPAIIPEGTTMIRAATPLDNTVEDAWLGGGPNGIGGHEGGGSEINHGNDERLFVGSETAPTHFPFFNKSFLRFSLDDIPPNKEIISATLTLHHWGNAGQDSGLARPSWVSLFTINDPWDEMAITWNNAPLAQENIAATWIYPLSSFPGWPGVAYDWDATQAVAEAYTANDPVSMAIYSSDNARDTTKYLTSSEMGITDPPAHWNWNEEGRPTLTVVWGEPLGDDFLLNASPSAQAIDVGGSTAYRIQVQPTGNFSSAITLTTNVPLNMTYTLVPDVVTEPYQEAILTVTDLHPGSELMPGEWHSIPITGTTEFITQTKNISVDLLVGGARVYLPQISR